MKYERQVTGPNQAIILAAGQARRLQRDEPKALLDVGGEPLVARLCRQLGELGLVVTVVTGHRAKEVELGLATTGARFVRNPDPRSDLGRSCGVGLDALSGDTAVVLGDTVAEKALLARVLRGPGELVLGVIRAALDEESMKVRVQEGRPVAIGKDLPLDVGFELTGVLVLRGPAVPALRLAIAAHPADRDLCHGPVRDLLGTELDCRAVDCTGLQWTEIDFPRDIQHLRHMLPSLRD